MKDALRNEYGEPLDANGYAKSVFPTGCCWYAVNGDRIRTACGGNALVRHEVFHGASRQTSKRYGAWVTLCPLHHAKVHDYPQFERPLKQETQRRVMERYGWTVDRFRAKFGKSYLL